MFRYLRSPFGIRFKLVVLSSFVVIVPFLGFHYILEMEEYLRRGQVQTVLGAARGLSTALNERPELFNEGAYGRARQSDVLYVYPVFYQLSLDDGTMVDWQDYQRYELSYGKSDTIG